MPAGSLLVYATTRHANRKRLGVNNMVTATELREFVDQNLNAAEIALNDLCLDEALAKNAAMIAEIPRFRALQLASAVKVSTAVLFVDMRGSTKRAMRLGPGPTFLTMHALLPTLAKLIEASDGFIVGYRGDGLFGVFGINEKGENAADFDMGRALADAGYCGNQMIQAVERVVCPALEDRGVEGDVEVGVGIDCGTIIVTRIGLPLGFEITAYGDAINRAAHLCSDMRGKVGLAPEARQQFPNGPGGTGRFTLVGEVSTITYPATCLRD